MIFAVFNPRSICNKTAAVISLLSDHDVDICCIAESWLKKADVAKHAEMKELGYDIHSKPRTGRGGGVAIIFKKSLSILKQKTAKYKSFECMESILKVSSPNCVVRIACVYRSGTPNAMSANVPLFLEEFEDYISSFVNKSGIPLIMGDFNIHVENKGCSTTSRFNEVILAHGWKQHVSSPTHIGGGHLDLVLSHSSKYIDSDVNKATMFPDVLLNCNLSTSPIDISELNISPTGTSSDHL